MDASNYQHLPFLFDLTHRVRSQASFCGRNSTRLQRAPKSARQSTAGGGHQVVEGGCVGLVYLEIHAVVFSHL